MTRNRLATSSWASTAEGSSMTISRASWRQRPGHADDLLAGGGQPSDLTGHRDLVVPQPGEQASGLVVLLAATDEARGDFSWPRKMFSATESPSTRSSSW